MKIYLLTASFYADYTQTLLQNAIKELEKHDYECVVVEVAGVGELPIIAQAILEHQKPAGIICLGIIIKGETDHYEWLIHQVERGLSALTLDYKTPIIQGIIPAHSKKVVEKRLDRGTEWAETLIKTINTIKGLKKGA